MYRTGEPRRCGGFHEAAGTLLIHLREAGEECPPEGGNCVERNRQRAGARSRATPKGTPPRARDSGCRRRLSIGGVPACASPGTFPEETFLAVIFSRLRSVPAHA